MVENTYYLDPNFDRSAIEPQITPDKYLGLVNPNIKIGERQVPGQDGWRLADTPQAWVYIQKKQWTDDTWTYVVADTSLSEKIRKLEDKIAERGRLQTQLNELGAVIEPQQRVEFEQKITKVGGEITALQAEIAILKLNEPSDRVSGKLQQIDIRSALGRIITRKIDWMSDHEKFTKVSGAVQNTTLGISEQRAYRKRMENLILNAANATKEMDSDVVLLQGSVDVYNKRREAAVTNIQSFRQAISDNNGIMVAKQNEYESIAMHPSVLPGDASEAQQLQEEIEQLTKTNEEYEKAIAIEEENITKLDAYIRQTLESVDHVTEMQGVVLDESLATTLVSNDELDLDPLVIEDGSPITFSGNAFTRYFKAPITRTKDTKQVQQYKTELEAEQKHLEDVIKQVVNAVRQRSNPDENVGAQDVSTEELDQLATVHKSYVEIKRKIYQLENALREGLDTAPAILEDGDPVFNGVMELANVSSINTTVTLEGEGSASITIENPQNVFYISEEDIILSLVDVIDVVEGATVRVGKESRTDMIYYKGAYYPSYIVQMLSRAPSASVDLSLISGVTRTTRKSQNIRFSTATLKEWLAQNEKAQQDVVSEVARGILARDVGEQRISELIVEHDDLQRQLEVTEEHAANKSRAAGDVVDIDWDEINSSSTKEILTRYFQGKTIFEVLDRIFIWMTTPTRTPFRLPGVATRFAIEDPAVLSSAQQKVYADNELNTIKVEIVKFNEFYKRMKEVAQSTGSGFKDTYIIPVRYQELSGLTVIYGDRVSDGDIYNNALEAEKGRLEAISKHVEKELADADSFTAARIRDRLSDKSSLGAYSNTQYEARSLGAEEQKLQVFQGVISSVKRSYSEGKYQITLSCRDNMVFLDMSRIMKKPALSIETEPIGILDDPIWRYTKRAGVWKDGILVINQHFIGDEVAQRIPKKIQLTELNPYNDNATDTTVTGDSQGRLKWTPLVLTEPFAQIDAANVISFLVTGVPYNPITFMQAASIGGRTPSTVTKSGVTDQQSKDTSYFYTLKKQVGSQNDRLGDFQPFLDFESGVYRKNDLEKQKKLYKDELASSLELLTNAYTNYVATRVVQHGKMVSANISAQAASLGAQNKNTCSTEGTDSTKKEIQGGGGKSKTFLELLLKVVKRIVETKGASTILTKKAADEKAKGNGATISDSQGQAARSANGKQSEWFKAVSSDQGLEGLMPVYTTERDELVGMLAMMTSADGPFGKISSAMLAQVGGNARDSTLQLLAARDIFAVGTKEESIKGFEYNKRLQAFVEDLFTYDLSYKSQFNAAIITTRRLNEYNVLAQKFEEFVGGFESKAATTSGNTGKMNTSPVPTPINLLASSPEKIIRKRKVNYLVISDRYTLDLDVQAFVAMIGFDPDLFQAETESPLSICRRAADEVDFEFYCDENGHLRFKPPTYNRILKEHYSKLGDTDRVAKDALLVEYGADYGQLVRKLIQAQSKIERALHDYEVKLAELNRIREEEAARRKVFRGQKSAQPSPNTTEALTIFTGPIVETPSACLGRVKTSLAFDLKVALEVESRLNDVTFYETTRLAEIPTESADTLEQIARLIALYTAIISAVKQLKSMAETSLGSARIKADNAVKKLDSFYDEFRIHKIPNYNLISSEFTEAPPRFTRLDLCGSPQWAQFFPAVYWAGAVDYDMWRNYGYIFERMQKAYFHDGAACIPYARAMLGRERGRIFSGSITVRGDAKYRVGDCVFIEDEGMYYYVTTVSQSFGYGSSYTTSLTLAYGRRIGEIIPHPFDVLGGIVLSTYQTDLETLLTQEVINRQKEKKDAEREAATQAANQ